MTRAARALWLLLALPLTAGAQRRDPVGATRPDTQFLAPVASLVLPGLGQAMLRQDRALAYVAVEAWALLGYLQFRTEGRRERDRFRAIAHDVARAPFATVIGGGRPVGDWDYYEAMEKWVESGVFDRFPGGEIDPEIDLGTYNGFMWYLARRTYWPDPDLAPPTTSTPYRLAYNFYLQRAVSPDYRWSWRDARLEQDLYRRSIARSNQAYRDARDHLGILLANHLLSAVDAFVTLRVGMTPAVGDQPARYRVQGRVGLPWGARREPRGGGGRFMDAPARGAYLSVPGY